MRAGRSLVIGGWVLTAVVVVWMYVPFVSLGVYALHNKNFFTLPIDPTLKWFAGIFGNQSLLRVLSYTFFKSLTAAVLATAVAIPGAIAYTRYDFPGLGLYKRLVLLPIFFPQLVLGIAILVLLHYFGQLPNTATMIVGECVLLVPIAVLVISIQLLGYSPEIERAAEDLGAGHFRIFRQVTLPLIAPGLLAAFLFAFTLSWGNFYIDLYAGSRATVPPWVYGHMQQGFSPEIPAVSVLAVTVSLILLLITIPIFFNRMRSGVE
ncbi:MAG: Inner membrane ABC transporter permease protein YdcV [Gammaproteobacteria bacterium]|nr:Inner membrane ABC transporter permease protein YdcV [Gammaproteobacteria bacterium]